MSPSSLNQYVCGFRSRAGFKGLQGVSSRWLSQRYVCLQAGSFGGCPSRVNEFAVIAAKTTRWRRPGFRVVLALRSDAPIGHLMDPALSLIIPI